MKNITKYTASLSGNVFSLSTYTVEKEKTPPPFRALTEDEIERHHQELADKIKATKPKRKKITAFSDASRRRLVKYTREVPKSRFTGLITLTYPDTPDVQVSKEDVNQFLEYMRRYANSLTFSALWIMEFQDRGTVHYHVWTNSWIPKGKITKAWNRIIGAMPDTPSTNVKAWKAFSKSGLSSYVAKYAKKQAQKELPEELDGAGRWWGKVGDVSTPNAVKTEVTREQYDEIKTDALNRGWKEIESEWCRVFIVDECDRYALLERLAKIKDLISK